MYDLAKSPEYYIMKITFNVDTITMMECAKCTKTLMLTIQLK